MAYPRRFTRGKIARAYSRRKVNPTGPRPIRPGMPGSRPPSLPGGSRPGRPLPGGLTRIPGSPAEGTKSIPTPVGPGEGERVHPINRVPGVRRPIRELPREASPVARDQMMRIKRAKMPNRKLPKKYARDWRRTMKLRDSF